LIVNVLRFRIKIVKNMKNALVTDLSQ